MQEPRINFLNRTSLRGLFVFLITIMLLTGCATLPDLESSQEFNAQIVGVINVNNSIGQVVTSRHRSINGLTIWLSRSNQELSPTQGYITLSIYTNTSDAIPIYSNNIPTSKITQFTPINFSFDPISVSESDSSVYIELSSSADDIVVHGRLGDGYNTGTAYINRDPIDADLAFSLSYYYDWDEFIFDIQGLRANFRIILIMLCVLFLPGYTLIRLFHLNRLYKSPEQLSFSAGFSLAIIPIVYLYASRAGIELTSLRIQLLGIACIVIIMIMLIYDRSYRQFIIFLSNPKDFFQEQASKQKISGYSTLWLLIGIFIFSFIVRWIMIRDLATPAWVDSFHHGLITRLILQNGSLPQTYQPYLDIEPTLYHPGYHSSLAAFISLSSVDISKGMLYFGQLINAVMGMSVYLFAVSLTRRTIIGLLAALLTSFFSVMPAYYTSWGRYPQLAGLIILPVIFSLIFTTTQQKIHWSNFNRIIPASIALAGLLLVHYRVAAFALCLFLSWFISELFSSFNSMRNIFKIYLFRFLTLGGLTILISSAWIFSFITETIIPRINPNHAEAPLIFFSDFSWRFLTPVFGKQIIVFATLGLLWSLLNKQKMFAIITGWVILLFFLANLDAFNLPGGSFVNNSSVTIMLFLPLSVMSGYLLEQIIHLWIHLLNKGLQTLFVMVTILVLLYFSFLGSKQLISILNPATLLTRQDDLSALQWIDKNIPEDETILINSFIWGYGLYAGYDGGAWVSTFTGNQTMPPPVLYGLGPSYQIERVNEICQESSTKGSSPNELWEYLLKQEIEYIYIGARGGSLSPVALSTNFHFETLYHQNNTWLFHLLP